SARTGPPRRGGHRHDHWLGRDVYVLELESNIARAAPYARADHPVLPTILRADREAGELWVEVITGRPIAQGRTLDDGQRREPREALAALHRAGAAHGAVDERHVYIHGTHARLAFPLSVQDGSPDEDLAALDALP